jgi:hypothetical protein
MHRLATGFPRAWRGWFLALTAACLVAPDAIVAAPLGWQVDITPGGELFPVLDLSQTPRPADGTVGGGSGLVAVRVTGDSARPLRLRVETEGLRAPAIVDATIDRAGVAVELRPRMDWDRTALRALTVPRSQTLRLTLETPDMPAQVREIPVRLHPLDDALYYVREGNERVDLGWVFAAYVDPHDPVVDEVLALVRDAGVDIVRPADTATDRLEQARAVWTALEKHGLRYAGGDPALSRGPSIYSQRVRLLADSWERRRANCIDSSVLIASVLERLGIRSVIVLVPGHAFVGFYTSAGREHPEFLETTVLGGKSTGRAGASTAESMRFDAARAAGRARWNRIVPRLDQRHRPDYALIDIETARSYGIIPLAAAGADGVDRPPAASAPAAPPSTPIR